MLKRSTIQLLRFHFSFFLLPVYLFALSEVPAINWPRALIAFFILHFLVYPASNGYNSYMDRDETPVGGIRDPLQPTSQLFYVTVIMDAAAIILSCSISLVFAAGILMYILASRAYSYRGIRLKQYAIAGYLTVIFFQGAVVFFLAYHAGSQDKTIMVPAAGLIASSLLIGGFYPLTQIYQHDADRRDGVKTISYLLGYRGTFIFTACVYIAAMSIIWYHFEQRGQQKNFLLLATIMLPVLVYFFMWAIKVWKNSSAADFTHTMRMNLIASGCTNIAFFSILTGRFI